MKQRKLGDSSILASEVGLGCWQLGGDFGPITITDAIHIIETALESGVTFFDTADVYGAGQSESILGDRLEQIKKDVKVATKYGRGEGTYPNGYTLQDMRDAVRRSCDRLRRDKIDLLQLHCVPPSVLEKGHVFDFLRQLQQDGLIDYFGASVETMDEAMTCLAHPDLTSLQIIFNLFRQAPKDTLFKVAKENQVGIIARLPLASGLLSGKFNASTSFAESDHRNYNKDGEAFSVGETFSGIDFSEGLKLVDALEQNKPSELTMANFAMRWILDHDAVTTIIPGASSAQQVLQNVNASAIAPLSEESHKRLYELYQSKIARIIRCPI